MSVWSSIEALRAFTYSSAHTEVLRRRREWFERLATAHLVLWWVPVGHIPTIEEALDRLDRLRRDGPTTEAFTFRTPFEPDAAGPGEPLVGAEFCWPEPVAVELASGPAARAVRRRRVGVLVAGDDEQGIGQAVEVGEHVLADRLDAGQGDDVALSAPADGAGHVQVRRTDGATRQEEVRQGPDHLIELVDQRLELLDVARFDRGDARPARVIRGPAQVRPEIEELVLDDPKLIVSRSVRPAARATPIVELHSSTVP